MKAYHCISMSERVVVRVVNEVIVIVRIVTVTLKAEEASKHIRIRRALKLLKIRRFRDGR